MRRLPRRPTPLLRPAAARAPVAALAALAALVAVTALSGTRARADKYPEPSPYQRSWQLKFEHGTPKRFVLDVPGTRHAVAYWYMTYTVTNPGDRPQRFVPQFDLLSEDGKVTRADQAIPTDVYNAIKHREGIKLLEPASKVEGAINPGDDEARDSVAIWPEPMPHMTGFTVFVGGLSGEFVEMKDKEGKVLMQKDPLTGDETRVVVRKTLALFYHVVGDEVLPGPDDDHQRQDQAEVWVMR